VNREVAIKVLPEGFAQDAERVARFQREAPGACFSKSSEHRRPVAPLSVNAASYVGRYRSKNGSTTMLVGVLDGQLSLVTPDAANPYTTRIILEPTSDPRTLSCDQSAPSRLTLSVNF
jgi:hypothetical protein